MLNKTVRRKENQTKKVITLISLFMQHGWLPSFLKLMLHFDHTARIWGKEWNHVSCSPHPNCKTAAEVQPDSVRAPGSIFYRVKPAVGEPFQEKQRGNPKRSSHKKISFPLTNKALLTLLRKKIYEAMTQIRMHRTFSRSERGICTWRVENESHSAKLWAPPRRQWKRPRQAQRGAEAGRRQALKRGILA